LIVCTALPLETGKCGGGKDEYPLTRARAIYMRSGSIPPCTPYYTVQATRLWSRESTHVKAPTSPNSYTTKRNPRICAQAHASNKLLSKRRYELIIETSGYMQVSIGAAQRSLWHTCWDNQPTGQILMRNHPRAALNGLKHSFK
jgi:hypothetical protein